MVTQPNSMESQPSILATLRMRQKKIGSKISVPDNKSRIAFSLPTKDRVQETKVTLATLDTERGFDVIWVDGSETPDGKALVDQYEFRNIRLIEAHKDMKGKEYAGYFGLDRLFDLGYDYFGLIENELAFEPGWFDRLLQLFQLAAEDGLAVGAATVRSYNGRVMEYRPSYTINWILGAGCVLYSSAAYQLIQNMRGTMTARSVRRFYAETLGIDLGEAIFRGRPDRIMGADWTHGTRWCENGLVAVGSIPSLAHDLILDVRRDLGDTYVEQNMTGRGLVRPKITWGKLQWMRFSDPFFRLGWIVMRKVPSFHRILQRKLAQRYQRKLLGTNSLRFAPSKTENLE